MSCTDSIRSFENASLSGSITKANKIDFCTCLYECDFIENVYALSGEGRAKNDFSTFLFKALDVSDTIDIELYKNGVKIADLDDDTYGEFFDFGTWNEVSAQELYKGYYLEWELVQAVHGNGIYTVQAQEVIFGNSSTFESHTYRLRTFSELIANETVVIRTVQNGCIMSSDFDYTGMNWQKSIRLKGTFGMKIPSLTKDNYFDSDRVKKQRQDSIANEYLLEVPKIPSNIYNVLIYDDMLANQAYISDYYLFNPEVYRDLPVDPKEIQQPDYQSRTTKVSWKITFEDRQQDILKRNFK